MADSDMENKEALWRHADAARSEHANVILRSQESKKVVVAGPGTGKTYLFKRILEGRGNALTLSFINSLVEDLALDLCGLGEVKTLHGFALSELRKIPECKDAKIFSGLSKVISADANNLLGQEEDFNSIFHNRQDDNPLIEFYRQRKNYYGKYYDFADIVFSIVKHYEIYPKRIPKFEVVLVDEFQDFNRLEMSLIDLLAQKSPILIAGDDDQALYGFKSASPDFIRDRYSDRNPEYAPHNLPYCSRCTRVVVKATNTVVREAQKLGILQDRMDKPYVYFDCAKKDKVSADHDKITYANLKHAQIPWFITEEIGKLAKYERSEFDVLVLSPLRKRCVEISTNLKKKGFKRVIEPKPKRSDKPALRDGFNLILQNQYCNLGWRIVCEFILSPDEFAKLLNETGSDEPEKVSGLISADRRKEIKSYLTALRRIRLGKFDDVDEETRRKLFALLEIRPGHLATMNLQNDIMAGVANIDSQRINPSIRNIPITLTTILSSKGLAADYIFITHFDDEWVIKDENPKNISDRDVCNLIVGLTRARKKVFLISTQESEPTFLSWIGEENIERR